MPELIKWEWNPKRGLNGIFEGRGISGREYEVFSPESGAPWNGDCWEDSDEVFCLTNESVSSDEARNKCEGYEKLKLLDLYKKLKPLTAFLEAELTYQPPEKPTESIPPEGAK